MFRRANGPRKLAKEENIVISMSVQSGKLQAVRQWTGPTQLHTGRETVIE